MSIEAMKQALEALEEVQKYDRTSEWFDKKVTALRQAIAEAEKQEPVAWIVDGEIKVRLDMAGKLYYSETNVYAAPVIAEAEKQEPVIPAAVINAIRNSGLTLIKTQQGYVLQRIEGIKAQPLHPAPVHASDISQERVDETPKCKDDPRAPHGFDRNASHNADRYVCECESWEPPKHEWVGLTPNDIHDTEGYFEDRALFKFAKAIEAKLKEKNGGGK